MTPTTISIEVDAESARAISETTGVERRKLELLLRLRLRELTAGATKPLEQIMDEMSKEAAAHGLTPEILESLLNDE